MGLCLILKSLRSRTACRIWHRFCFDPPAASDAALSFPPTEYACVEVLSRPLHPDLSDEEVARVVREVVGWASKTPHPRPDPVLGRTPHSLTLCSAAVLGRYFRIYEGSINGERAAEFLQALLRHLPGKLLVI